MDRAEELVRSRLADRMGVSPDIFSSSGTYISKTSQGSPFQMMTTGEGLVVATCPELHQWSEDHLSSLSYGEAFEAYWIARIQDAVREAVGARLWKNGILICWAQ